MRKIFVIALVLLFQVSTFAAAITDVDELFAEAANDGAHTIATGTYKLAEKGGGGADLTITGDWALTISGSGTVIIDGNDAHRVLIQDCTSTFTGADDTNRIIFTQGDTSMVNVTSVASTTVTFNYCSFSETNAGNGLMITADPPNDVTVTCNNCKSFNNEDDGFSILGTNANSKVITMDLNDCDSYSNGTTNSDQGATCHSVGQYLNINGGNYYSNFGPGIAVVGAGFLNVKDATFYRNGVSDVHLEALARIDNCVFYDMNSTIHIVIPAAGQGAYITNCLFRDEIAAGMAISALNGFLFVENCIFKGVSKGAANKYCIQTTTGVDAIYVKNTTFYDYKRAVNINGVPEHLIVNNIFHTAGDWSIRADNEEYKLNPNNGYNYFYLGTASDFYRSAAPTGTDQSQSTDVLDVDPQMFDPANDNFRLKPTSPCLNTGLPIIQSGFCNIGAWQRKSFLRIPE